MRTVRHVTTETSAPVRQLRTLTWLYWERQRPREWVTFRENGWNVHVLGGNGVFVLTIRRHPSHGLDATLSRRIHRVGDVPWVEEVLDVSRCPDVRAAKAVTLARVDEEIQTLERTLLAATQMASAGIRLLAYLCDNDLRLRGDALLDAAAAVRSATEGS
jgi:hypothetical protein